MGSGRSAGFAIGEDRTSPCRAIKPGIRSDHVPGLAQARAGSPDPSRGTCKPQRRAFTDTRPQRAPPSERHGCVSCAIIWVCQVHNMGVPCTWRSVCSVRGTPKVCHNMGVPWHSPNRCTRMQEMRPNHRRTSRTPIGARWPRARAALPHTDQLGSAAAPSHWDSHQMNGCCKSIMFVTPRRAATCRRGRFARARPRTPSPAASSVSITPAAS